MTRRLFFNYLPFLFLIASFLPLVTGAMKKNPEVKTIRWW